MDIKALRIAALRVVMGGTTQKAFAKRHGFNASYLSQIMNGHRNLGERTAAFLEEKIGLPKGALVYPLSFDEGSISTVVEPGPTAARQSDAAGDEAWITHCDLRALVGDGQVPHDLPQTLQDVQVNPQHLREMGVKFSRPHQLTLVTGWDQSMEPTIRQGDLLIVDAGVREFTGDGIYLFSWGDGLYIKRLQIVDEDHFEMISDNARHKDRVVLREEACIQGRVLLVWNVRRV